MKGNVPGLIITAIIIFNIFFLLVYFLLKFWKHDRRLDEHRNMNNAEPRVNSNSENGESGSGD